MSCLCQLLEGDLDGGRKVKGRRNHRQNQLRDFNFFCGKIKKMVGPSAAVPRQAAWIAVALCEDCAAPGEFCDAEQWMCLSWRLSFGGGTGKQESISSQPRCQFSPNCRNLIPLGTSVSLSVLLKIDQQIQRSPGSIKHEHISLISFGNWIKKKEQQSIFLHNSQ